MTTSNCTFLLNLYKNDKHFKQVLKASNTLYIFLWAFLLCNNIVSKPRLEGKLPATNFVL